MRVVADLHLHSRYSRACSPDLSIATLEAGARRKGIDLLGTGDFQHPEWMSELRRELSEDGTGILRTRSGFPFMLTTEISLVYAHNGRTRKVHLLLWVPDFATAEAVQGALRGYGRIDYDGRPTFGVPCERFVHDMRSVSKRVEIVPAHAWTPWFGVLGEKGGYDSLAEAFGSQIEHVHAIETGLSSDPEMNRRLSALDSVRLVSFSDAHSAQPWRLGREATIFELAELAYDRIIAAVRTGEDLVGTIEVDPAYGKYHYDGHRDCKVSFAPEESLARDGICPVCGRPLTIGVDHRVHVLADRIRGSPDRETISTLPLHELIGIHTETGIASKRVSVLYEALVPTLGTEFDVLLRVPIERIAEATNAALASVIEAARGGRINVTPGYDGVYGVAKLPAAQRTLGSF